MTQKVLVTGGTGYVAGWCIVALLQSGYEVRATVRSAQKGEVVRNSVASQIDPGDRLTFAITDLTRDDGWDEAMQGCDFVLHVASPLGLTSGLSADQLVATARQGTLRVVNAAIKAGVKRVVMTSAANASSPSSYTEAGTTDETLWTNPDDPTLIPYRRSKTAAEKAAWDLIAVTKTTTTLATILPGAVFGPLLSKSDPGSVQIIARLLNGEMPGLPQIGFEVVDVRDLADIHIKAMISPKAAGQRFLATGEFVWMADIANILKSELGAAAKNVPQRVIPDLIMRISALFRPELREITISLGRRNRHTTAKARQLLGWQTRPVSETIADCAKSLIQWKIA